MTDSAFERATRVTPIADGRFSALVPDGWQQGRGAFGGLVLATLVRAVERSEGDATRRVRTLAGDLCGPVAPGPAEIAVRILRRGSNQTNVHVELTQEGQVMASALVLLSAPRAVDAPHLGPEPPVRPPFSGIDAVEIGPPIGPVFASHYSYRNVGPFPFSAGPDPLAAGWIAEREPLARMDAPAMVARLDAWWPALFATLDHPRPMATVQFTAELFVDPTALDPRQPLFHRGRVVALRDGLFLELRELWGDDGLVAMNQQTMAILR